MKLDDIKAAADAKYASVPVEFGQNDKVSLLNPIRLSKQRREQLADLQSALSGEDAGEVDQVEQLEKALLIVAGEAGEAAAKRLIKAINKDLAVLSMVFNGYIEAVQAGEA